MKPLPPFDPARSAVLVIDMQRDFIDPGAPIATPGGPAIVPAVNRLVALGRGRGLPVIFTQEMHRADRSDFGIELEFEPPHCLEGTPGMLEPTGARGSGRAGASRGRERHQAALTLSRERQARPDVLWREVREVAEDLLLGHPRCQVVKD